MVHFDAVRFSYESDCPPCPLIIHSAVSVFGLLDLGEQESEPFLRLNSLFAELVVGTEPGGVSIESVGAVIQDNFHGVDSLSVIVQIVPQIHALLFVLLLFIRFVIVGGPQADPL